MPKKKISQKPVEYCTLEPDFPQTAYILFLFVMHEGQSVGMVPLDGIYRDLGETTKAVKHVLKQLGKSQHITIPEEAILLPITFSKLFPMRQEFWREPSISYDQHLRVKSFSPVAHYPTLYSLLVTPYAYNEKKTSWLFNATLPFLEKSDTSTLEKFMYQSDQIVEPKAKHSAIYTIGQKKRFNWKTKEVKEIDTSITELLGKVN